ncbi:molybdopterin-binding oxidoreductase [Geobacter metallireducens GS-15]|uniref:Molybdopterin-binding oxidoreductase n=2 Tax=Geobacter metallireducens TaxID=28232 RepID=Q39TH0_GEOMG|nr:molybdopterin-dependent oxidoreductase [Geobacter metallireducens]ABB32454.1 molybdopterin-binding oxidoreductase [Geobacter metallireducens GS-15]
MTESNSCTKRTFCTICPQHCGVLVTVKDGRPVAVKGDPTSPIGSGSLCVKGPRVLDLHEHPGRLNYPLKRIGARGEMKWEQISWEQALDEIAAKLSSLRDQFGPEMLATLGGTHKGPGDWSSWRFCNLFGTPNFVNQGRNCGVGHILAESSVYGYDTMYAAVHPGKTMLALIWGSNPAESGTTVMERLIQGKKQGMKIVVVDPRKTRVAEIADIWVPVRPRTDGALALGIAHVMLREGLYDREFVAAYCQGFDEAREVIEQYPPERVAAICGIPVEMIEEVARLYGTVRPARLVPGVALVQAGQGASRTATLVRAILVAISGNLDVLGGDPLAMKYDEGQFAWLDNIHWDALVHHPLRTRDTLGSAEFPIIGVEAYKRFRETQARLHPKGHNAAAYMLFANQNAIYRAVLAEEPYPVKAVIVQNGEPLLSMGGARAAHDAFTSPNLDLLVTMDLFMTPTAQLSDYVLPAAHYLERPDISMHWGLTHLFVCGEQAVEPLFERRNDYELWKGLGKRLGQEDRWPADLEGMLNLFLAPSGRSFAQWTKEERNYQAPRLMHKKHEQQGFATPSGKVELLPTMFERAGIEALPVYEGPPYSTPEVDDPALYPYHMIAGNRTRYFMGSNLHQIEALRKHCPDPPVWIHPETAARHGINDGEWVIIERPEGRIRQKALLTDKIRPDTVQPEGYWWYPEREPGEPGLSGLWEANANAITPTDIGLCSFAGDQPLRGGRCRIAPAGHPALGRADILAGLQALADDLERLVGHLDSGFLERLGSDSRFALWSSLVEISRTGAQSREWLRNVSGVMVADGNVATFRPEETLAVQLLDKLIDDKRALCQEMLQLVAGLSQESLAQCCRHPDLGEGTVESLLWSHMRHEANQSEKIRQLLTGMR